jgi:hypothetical protein
MTFGQYFQKLLQGSCQAPELAPQVYEMSEAAAQQQWQGKLLYTEAGGIATTGTDGLLALHQVRTAPAAALHAPCYTSGFDCAITVHLREAADC